MITHFSRDIPRLNPLCRSWVCLTSLLSTPHTRLWARDPHRLQNSSPYFRRDQGRTSYARVLSNSWQKTFKGRDITKSVPSVSASLANIYCVYVPLVFAPFVYAPLPYAPFVHA